VARAAVNEMLARGGKDTSMPWENPDTGARGTITPLASAYTQEGSTCRDFQAGDRILAAGRSVPSCAGEMGSVPSAPLEEHVTNLPPADLVA
jgi:hypothetical protein